MREHNRFVVPFEAFGCCPASTPSSLRVPVLSWGYAPSRSIRSDAISRIGYENPLRPLLLVSEEPDLEVFAPLLVRRTLTFVGRPPTELHSPTEYNRACLSYSPTRVRPLPWGSFPYDACGSLEPTRPGFASPGSLRFQVFSTS